MLVLKGGEKMAGPGAHPVSQNLGMIFGLFRGDKTFDFLGWRVHSSNDIGRYSNEKLFVGQWIKVRY